MDDAISMGEEQNVGSATSGRPFSGNGVKSSGVGAPRTEEEDGNT